MRPHDFDRPRVSVIVANRNCAPYLAEAIASARRQSLENIEILVVDDASSDGSVAIVEQIAKEDTRIRLFRLKNRAGPATARNVALKHAMGEWVAVLDSDDVMHPDRLRSLLAEAESSGAAACADDLLVFGDGLQARAFLGWPERSWVDLDQFISWNGVFQRKPALATLKPFFSRSFLLQHNLLYDESLVIGEDYDFVARILACGGRLRVLPQLTYFYRKHTSSASYRISADQIRALMRANESFGARFQGAIRDPSLLVRRHGSLTRALRFVELMDALKSGSLATAGRIVLRNPSALLLLHLPAAARLRRGIVRRRRPPFRASLSHP